jgi:hypothetical protein
VQIAAGLVSAFLGFGFGLPCVFGIRHYLRTGQVWTFLGFPTYGGGPFERVGLTATLPLMFGFLVVCIAEVVLGAMLMIGAPQARKLSHALLPFEFFYWIGFALPAGPPLGLLRLVLVLLFKH